MPISFFTTIAIENQWKNLSWAGKKHQQNRMACVYCIPITRLIIILTFMKTKNHCAGLYLKGTWHMCYNHMPRKLRYSWCLVKGQIRAQPTDLLQQYLVLKSCWGIFFYLLLYFAKSRNYFITMQHAKAVFCSIVYLNLLFFFRLKILMCAKGKKTDIG